MVVKNGKADTRFDGVLAKYLLSKSLPDDATLTIKRLAKYMKHELGIEGDGERIMDPFWVQARQILRTALNSHKVKVGDEVYVVQRVESWPDYKVVFQREGAENNGSH